MAETAATSFIICTLPNRHQWRRRPHPPKPKKPISPPVSIPDQSSLHHNIPPDPSNFASSSGEIASQIASSAATVLRRGKGIRIREFVEFVKEVEGGGVRAVGVLDGKIMDEVRRECWRVVKGGGCGDLEFVEAMETLKGYQFVIKDLIDPVEVLKIFVNKHDPDMAVRYATIYPHSQFLYCTIIQEFGKKKDLGSALKAFEEIKKSQDSINMFMYRSIIDVCGLCGNPLKSRDIFKDLLSVKVTPNIYVFNSLMNVNAHDLNYTLYVYKHMQNSNVLPDLTSYNILLKSCCLAKRVDMARTIYKDIKHMESTRSLKLDVITYTTMIKTFADAKMSQMALEIKEDMLIAGVTPNVVTWSSLIGSCAKVGLVDLAVQVFDDMILAGCEPNSQCCNNLLNSCVQSCQYDRAFRLFNSWKVDGIRIYPSNSSHDQHLGFSKVVPFKPTVITYNILMKACGCDYYHAKNLMDEMKTMRLSPNQISWSILIDIYGNTQNMSAALQAFNTMRAVGIIPDVIAYTSAIKACIEGKNIKTAFSLFEQMKIHRVQPNMITYSTLLRARTRYGSLYEVQQCLAIYQDMRKVGYRSNDYFLKELIEEWCEEVISGSSINRPLLSLSSTSFNKSDMNEPQSLLLEKVALHLQKDVGDDATIDLRGLTRVEARIFVLSVLRMIKENYGSGFPIKGDMVIITGLVGKEAIPDILDTNNISRELEVQQAIIRVLQVELDLEVLIGPASVLKPTEIKPVENFKGSDDAKMSLIPKDSQTLARRPEEFGMLKVSKTTLLHWLQRKNNKQRK